MYVIITQLFTLNQDKLYFALILPLLLQLYYFYSVYFYMRIHDIYVIIAIGLSSCLVLIQLGSSAREAATKKVVNYLMKYEFIELLF